MAISISKKYLQKYLKAFESVVFRSDVVLQDVHFKKWSKTFPVAKCVGTLLIQSGMTLSECMTLPENMPTTIFSVKLMHLCIKIQEERGGKDDIRS